MFMERRIDDCMDLDLSSNFGIVQRAVMGILGVAKGRCRRFALRRISARNVSGNISCL